MERLYVDVHIIQTVPPSNLNRDDAGSPKQATYGGVKRARVSSQAWKRATRKAFTGDLPLAEQGTRTKRIASLLASRLMERAGLDEEQASRLATHVLAPLEIKPGKRKETETAYLLFFGRSQLEAIADLVADRAKDLAALDDKALANEVKELPIREVLQEGHPLDVALFGRMVADIPALNVDAATQVAHAISTHRVDIEFDYYTAVDDEKSREAGDDAGAEMIGTIEFNAATLYRYATVGAHQLLDNLGGSVDDTIEGVARFVDGFAKSMPSGHQNSFAHRTLPSAVVVVVRRDQPVNLVSAFETPVSTSGGLVPASVTKLAGELRGIGERWADEPVLVAATYDPAPDESGLAQVFGPARPFPELVDELRTVIAEALTTVDA
ncbi:type I-E CRISPR-associated protein Cas7/Cse4/CasC [Nitriliruptoraceae bacterium ZYF776]|nr:type I-E CRISPR-associated protein Cas7/Cse4/CasC [Profundirhabdus halotolerans]